MHLTRTDKIVFAVVITLNVAWFLTQLVAIFHPPLRAWLNS